MTDENSPAPSPSPETLCARTPKTPESRTRPLSPPISPSVVFTIDDLEQVDALYQGVETGFIYARDGHPNATQLAQKLAGLEGTEAGLVCSSGMAAEAAVLLALLDAGTEAALSEGVYGKTATLLHRELARFGVTVRPFDATRPETLREVLTPSCRLAFVETISNPLLRIADLDGLADVSRSAGVTLIVDNTFAPMICRPAEHGAEVVTHSLTKLIGGHSDLTLGAALGSSSLIQRTAEVASTFGMTGNPFECWLCLRGLTTLGVRSRRACATALELAHRLEAHAAVRAVHYPGLPSHPDHDRAGRLLQGGFGTIVTIDLGGRDQAQAFIRTLRQIPFAPSLGDVATTLSHPATTSHRGQPPEQWARQGITHGLIRLSIGLEDPDDLWADLASALDALQGLKS